MRLAVVSLNLSFWWQLDKELSRHHTLRFYRPTVQYPEVDMLHLGQLCQWADLIFCEFAQQPMDFVVAFFPSKHIAVRLARVEIYQEAIYDLDWNAVDLMIFESEHVKQRFFDKLLARNRARGLVINRPMKSVMVPGNMYDPEQFRFTERKFEKPYRMCIAGHLVPKKRQYDLVQMFADLPKYFTLDIAGGTGMPGYGNPEYPQNVQDLIEELELGDRVKLAGEIPYARMPAFYAAHDLLVSNSNEEGDALNITEGIACGLYPLISCWRGAAKHYDPIYVFHTPREFVNNLEMWASLRAESKLKLSREASQFVEKYRMGPWAEKVRLMLEEVAARDKIEAHYDHTCEEDVYQGMNERIAGTIEWVKGWIKPGMKALSLGCGIGLLEEALAGWGIDVLGVDLSERKIAEAVRRTAGKKGLRFMQGDVLGAVLHHDEPGGDIALPALRGWNEAFDACLMVDFIEHIRLEDHEQLLRGLDGITTPHGLVLINMPSPASPRGGRVPQPIDEAVDPERLAEELARHGFPNVLESTQWGNGVYWKMVVSR